ncbi:MAG TPA: sigma 54-interacting transcriptional regulator [Elusimicrobiales bacterium]|nr:sigma 54-interacting transcriptional regulator [Elusimicrobiales bacterium]
MQKLKILVIEDDSLAREVMAENLAGHAVDFAADKAAAERRLKAGDYDICFVDLLLGVDDDYSGLKLIPLAAAKKIYTVVMSGCDTEDTISRAYALGCSEFYVKGNEVANIPAIIVRYLQGDGGKKAQEIFAGDFITHDPETRGLVTEALKYAATSLPLMILGPSGTGKTTLAQLLHDHSGREGDFVAMNCSAYTEDLLEAELFGYKRGAFTGAHENRKGKLAQADKGTLFLDEIGAMSQNMQVKLLKAIEEKRFSPLGSDKPEYSDFRVMSATLEDVQKLLAEKQLRFDFFQRVHGMTITLKPLAQRKCDIFPLMQALTRKGKRLAFEPEAREYVLAHNWPGNTRELKRFVELVSAGTHGQVTLETARRHITPAAPATAATGAAAGEYYDYALKHGLAAAVDRLTGELVNRSLDENGGKRAAVLAQLKISKRLLYGTLSKTRGPEGK